MIRGVNLGFFRRTKEINRPVVRPDLSPADWLIEALALIMMGIFLGYVVYQYPRLPALIPTHFNASGIADDYGSKSSLIAFTVIALVIYLLMTLINLVPYTFNFPGKITPANALHEYTLATRLIRVLKAIIVTLFFFICLFTNRIVSHQSSGLGIWFMPIFLALIFIPLVIYYILASHKK